MQTKTMHSVDGQTWAHTEKEAIIDYLDTSFCANLSGQEDCLDVPRLILQQITTLSDKDKQYLRRLLGGN